MKRLVDDLLTLSALESDTTTRARHRSPSSRCCWRCRGREGALRRPAHDRARGRRCRRPSSATATARERIRQPRDNAIRYTPDGGTVTLGWQPTRTADGEFGVTDTGIGIAPEHIPRLTERFYRVDRSRSRATGGTGPRACHRQARAAAPSGRARRRERAGNGSTFTCWFRRGACAGRWIDRSRCGLARRRRGPLPVVERSAEQRLEVVAPDVLRRVPDHAVLRLGTGGQRIEMRRSKPSAARPFGIAVARISSITRPRGSRRRRRARAPRVSRTKAPRAVQVPSGSTARCSATPTDC